MNGGQEEHLSSIGILVSGDSLANICRSHYTLSDFSLSMNKKNSKQIHESVKQDGVWHFCISNDNGEVVREWEKHNMTPDIMLQALAAQIAGTKTTNLGDNLYIALGTGTTAVAAGDTTLDTETVRKAASDNVRVSTTGKVTVFFTSAEVSGTYNEVGLFSNGLALTASGSADTGVLNSRLVETITLSSGENLTCTFNITSSRA